MTDETQCELARFPQLLVIDEEGTQGHTYGRLVQAVVGDVLQFNVGWGTFPGGMIDTLDGVVTGVAKKVAVVDTTSLIITEDGQARRPIGAGTKSLFVLIEAGGEANIDVNYTMDNGEERTLVSKVRAI